MALQKRPARHIRRHCFVINCCLAGPQHFVAAEREVKLGQFPVVQNGSTVDNQPIENPGEQLIQDLCATRQQKMGMSTLRYPPPVRGIVGQHISFHHRDGPEEIGQHPRGEQPAHARPKNNRTLTQFLRVLRRQRQRGDVGDLGRRDRVINSCIAEAAGAAGVDGHGGLLGSVRVDYPMSPVRDHRS